MSEVEAFVLRHDWEITAAIKIQSTLLDIELTFYEAQVLYWVIWKHAPIEKVADFLDLRIDEVKDAERSLLTKVADAMGPVERDIVENRRRGA